MSPRDGDTPDAPETDLQQASPDAEAPEVDPALETEAREFGWRPQEEWKGPAEKWMPADKFLDYGRHSVPILRKQNSEARAEIDKLKRELSERGKVFDEFVKERQTSEQRMYDKALKTLKQERIDAIASGDTKRFAEIESAIEDLPKPKAETASAPATNQPRKDPDYDGWVRDNPWYLNDPVLQGVADGILKDMRAKGDPRVASGGRTLFDAIGSRVKQEMPQKFGGGRVNPVEGGGGGNGGAPPRQSKTGFNALPAEAKQQFSEFVSEGLFKDDDKGRAKYAEYYHEGDR